MTGYKEYFKGKKITHMGLGLLGRGVGDIAFLAECGADLIVTDLKSREDLKESIDKLAKYKNITYTLGEHKLEDFRDRDMIIKSAGVPIDSIYIKEARDNNIPIEMSAALVSKLSGATSIGVTGTRGKSMTTQLIYEILKGAGKRVYLGGNLRGVVTLPILKDIKEGDYVVFELDSWQLQGFGESKISPNVGVFTTFLSDHLNYYKKGMEQYFADKANIFKYQDEKDTLVVTPQSKEKIEEYFNGVIKSSIELAKAEDVPEDWSIKVPGVHFRQNIACAVAASSAVGVEENEIKKVVEGFCGLEGRLQYLRTVDGVKIYNDNNSTTPDATIAGLKALGENKNIVLIIGGADKGLDMSVLIKEIPKYSKAVVLFKEKGTDRIRDDVINIPGIEVSEQDGLENCLNEAIALSKEGDIVLYSPSFASFGKYFKNEYERGDLFIKLVSELK
ncbi:MAG: UDP-N-acetylmuramoyl-L-alanine--D-glutamate ligase [Parcubacteria group bacterium]|nr:UDP-N-acetylmuramoyl-L-alanine--D-glutamate ligase [Parcubacteria group bacterium]